MDSKIKDIPQAKKELEKEMLKGIIEYLKYGKVPNNNVNSFMNVYIIVKEVADLGYKARKELFAYYSKIISNFVDFSFQKITKESNINFIDSFIENTEKINTLINWMYKIFSYIERLHENGKQTLSKNAMEIYTNKFFIPIQKKNI